MNLLFSADLSNAIFLFFPLTPKPQANNCWISALKRKRNKLDEVVF